MLVHIKAGVKFKVARVTESISDNHSAIGRYAAIHKGPAFQTVPFPVLPSHILHLGLEDLQ